MAGKKARCPKCNEVNDIPPLEDQASVAATEPVVESESAPAEATAPATPAVETPPAAAVETPAPAASVENATSVPAGSTQGNSASLPKLSKGWVLGFAGSGVLLAVAAALMVFQMVDLSLICFAAGTILFCVLAVMFVFADSLGKRK